MRLRDVRSAAALWAFALLAAACSSSTDAPVATSIQVTPAGALNFVSLNATATLTARVLDQNGDSMPSVAVTWSTSAGAVATVNPSSGLVTAVANGTATLTATAGSLTANVSVTVAQAVATLTKTGDTQTGTVGAALANAISVKALDALGTAVVGASVAFAVTGGGGNVANPTVTTNATGDAQTTWTIGTVAGAAQTATATSAVVATFSATALAGAAAAIVTQAGDNQTRTVGLAVTVAPSVRVNDSFGNAKSGVSVTFAVAAGGGQVTGAVQTTSAGGIATVGSWIMGAAGANSLSATVTGTAITTSFAANATVAGAPTDIAVFVGNNQTALVGYPTNVRPAVLVTDATAQPVAGVSVTFAVTAGGGGVTNATVNTNAQGIAQVGAWTGLTAGANTMTATAAPGGITGNPVAFTATGAAPAYNIVIQNIGPAFSPSVQSAFDSAVAKWQRIIYQDVPDFALNLGANACGQPHPAINQNVDDIIIMARIDSIDGPFNVLGSAGFCVYRNPGTLLPVLGIMRFDSADMARLELNNQLKDVILHEMGHSLGYGTLWPTTLGGPTFPGKACLQNPSAVGNPLDTYFAGCGTTALAIFDSIGGTNYTGGLKVPVENCGPASPGNCGGGSINGHWREPTFGPEVLTGFLFSGVTNAFSVLSIAGMGDLGYVVNYGAADPYTQIFTAAPMLRAGGQLLDLSADMWTGPLYAGDSRGRLTRVR